MSNTFVSLSHGDASQVWEEGVSVSADKRLGSSGRQSFSSTASPCFESSTSWPVICFSLFTGPLKQNRVGYGRCYTAGGAWLEAQPIPRYHE